MIVEQRAEMKGRLSKYSIIDNFNLIFIILFHVLG